MKIRSEEDSTHEVGKNIMKVRALLRMVRSELGPFLTGAIDDLRRSAEDTPFEPLLAAPGGRFRATTDGLKQTFLGGRRAPTMTRKSGRIDDPHE